MSQKLNLKKWIFTFCLQRRGNVVLSAFSSLFIIYLHVNQSAAARVDDSFAV